ncbi:MAG TPA: hypothetical protein VFZ76_14950 [Anaerolineales bacterium]
MSTGQEIIQRVSKSNPHLLNPERLWVIGFASAVMLVTLLPYMLGFANEGENWRFTGFLFGVEDGNSYIAKMMAGAAGDWLFYTPYTAYPQSGVIAFLPYLILGKLTSPPAQHVQLVVVYHLFRLGAGILATLATYDFLSLFISDLKLRRYGLVLATLGGGLGWVLVLVGKPFWLNSLPLEYYSPESFGFLALFGLPHLAMARALLLWGLVSYLRMDEQSGSMIGIRTIAPGILLLSLGLFQPLTVVVAWAVLGTHIGILAVREAVRSRSIKLDLRGKWLSMARGAAASILISSPIVIYTLVKFNLDPVLRLWTSQNLIISPHPGHYLLAYGLLIPFAVGGAYMLVKDKPFLGWLPAGWVIILPILAYAPYNLQRRLPEGIWVAFVVLAIASLENKGTFDRSTELRPGGSTRFSFLKGLALLLALPSTILLYVGGLQAVKEPAWPVYRPAEEVEAFEYLAKSAPTDAIVLASYESGNPLPAWAPVRVIVGHGPESIRLEELSPQVEGFYSASGSDADRLDLLERFSAGYVLWGPHEKSLGAWNPARSNYLDLVYEHGNYSIFEFSGAKSGWDADLRSSTVGIGPQVRAEIP